MRKKNQFAIVLILIISVIAFSGCGDQESEERSPSGDYYQPGIQNLIFYGTWEIRLEVTPNVPNPSFAWDSVGLKYVIITVFRSRIDIKDNQIANPEEAVWTWNTGMGRGREGNVSYSDGRDVRNGVIKESVTHLAPGTYFVAAWGYSEDYNLIYSSKEYKHTCYP